MRVLVTGGYGFLGGFVDPHLRQSGHDVFLQGRSSDAQVSVDPSDGQAMRQTIEAINPDVIVNLIAMTSVDACEEDSETAYVANAGCVQAIAEAISKTPNTHLVHISTDQVYSGTGPHREDSASPVNVYAITKLLGDLIALRCGGTVLRTNFIARSIDGNRGLSDWIVNSLRSNAKITAFEDVLFAPLHAQTLSSYIELAAQKRAKGIYNLGAHGGVSKAEFVSILAKLLRLDTSSVTYGSSSDIDLKAKRPIDMRMNLDLFETTFGIELPTSYTEVKKLADEYGTEEVGVSAT